jgi:hypothetical protein
MKRISLWSVLIGAIVTTVVGTIGTMGLNYFSRQEPSLEYTSFKSPDFFGRLENTAVYSVELSNTGKKEATRLRGTVTFPGGTIDSHKADMPVAMERKEEINREKNSYTLTSPTLNPKDRVSLSFVILKGKATKDPTIDFRADGEVAREVQFFEESTTTAFLLSSPAIWLSVVVLVVLMPLLLRTTEKTDSGRADFAAPSKTLAYLCFRHGLVSQGEELLRREQDVSYWSESDRLATLALTSEEPDTTGRIKAVLEDLLNHGVIDNNDKTSQRIVAFNVGKIWLTKGDRQEAMAWLKRATEKDDEVINRRLKIDEDMARLL